MNADIYVNAARHTQIGGEAAAESIDITCTRPSRFKGAHPVLFEHSNVVL